VNTWKVILATMVIFGTGVITGALVVRQSEHIKPLFVSRSVGGPYPQHPAPTPKGVMPPGHIQNMEFLNRVQRELNLTPVQRERIEKIISEGQVRNKELWEPVAKQMRQEMQQVRERIRAELTLEQRLRFEELLKQRPPRRLIEPPMQERHLRDPRRPLQPPPGNPPLDGGPQQAPPGGQPPPPDNP
jgi:hypothetical protein